MFKTNGNYETPNFFMLTYGNCISWYKRNYPEYIPSMCYRLSIYYAVQVTKELNIPMSPDIVDFIHLYMFTDKEVCMWKFLDGKKIRIFSVSPYTLSKVMALNQERLKVSPEDLELSIKDCSDNLKNLFRENLDFLTYRNIMGAKPLVSRVFDTIEILKSTLQLLGLFAIDDIIEQVAFGVETGLLYNDKMIGASLSNLGISSRHCRALYPLLSNIDFKDSELERFIVQKGYDVEYEFYLDVCSKVEYTPEVIDAMIKSGGRVDESLYRRLDAEYSSLIDKPIVFTKQNGTTISLIVSEYGITYNGNLILPKPMAMFYRILRYTPKCILDIVGTDNVQNLERGYIQYFYNGYAHVYSRSTMNSFSSFN